MFLIFALMILNGHTPTNDCQINAHSFSHARCAHPLSLSRSRALISIILSLLRKNPPARNRWEGIRGICDRYRAENKRQNLTDTDKKFSSSRRLLDWELEDISRLFTTVKVSFALMTPCWTELKCVQWVST